MQHEEASIKLRQIITARMAELGMTQARLADLTGINKGNLSAILSGRRKISLEQLDIIDETLSISSSNTYAYYIGECYREGKMVLSRCEKYLIKCSELGMNQCIKIAVSHLLEESSRHIGLLYNAAELLYRNKRKKEALGFYEIVIENEKNRQSERLAISCYRRTEILISIQMDTHTLWESAIQLEMHYEWLPDPIRLEAYVKLAGIYYTLERWGKVERYADELRALATAVYNSVQRRFRKGEALPLELERPLVFYYGQGYLLKAVVLQRRKRLEEALRYVTVYEDLRFFKILPPDALPYIDRFTRWGRATRYGIEIQAGRLDRIDECISFLEKNRGEILSVLSVIAETLNRHGQHLGKFLAVFQEEIRGFDMFTDLLLMRRNCKFKLEKVRYHLARNEVSQGIDDLLQVLKLSDKLGDQENLKTCVTLFEGYRDRATNTQRYLYKKTFDGSVVV